tara:strand:+ start:602 stop:1591 length:990 start_codon:yes stop_codon:yes gene_type:complete
MTNKIKTELTPNNPPVVKGELVGYTTTDSFWDSGDSGFSGALYRIDSDEAQDALALDSYGDPRDDIQETLSFRREFVRQAAIDDEFRKYMKLCAGRNASHSRAYYERRARSVANGDDRAGYQAYDFNVSYSAAKSAWQEELFLGNIGNKYAVLLDVYKHSGEYWSVSEEGRQCGWDTSRGAGVFVPDEYMEPQLDSEADIYAFGSISETSARSEKNWAVLIDGEPEAAFFASQETAFEWLKTIAMSRQKPKGAQALKAFLALGRERATKALARKFLEDYNAAINGDVHGVIVEKRDETTGCTSIITQTWGVIGSDYAEILLTETMLAHL